MDIPNTLFATMIRNARMDLHWTQEDLAEKLGLSSAYLGDLERYKGTPSLPVFCKTMRVLNLSADDYVILMEMPITLHTSNYCAY